jgi:hypothetical protein
VKTVCGEKEYVSGIEVFGRKLHSVVRTKRVERSNVMTHNRFFTSMRNLLLIGLFMVFSTNVLKAEPLKGSFFLPFDAYWSGVLLPAGQYSFVIDSTGREPIELRTSEGKTIFRIVAYTDKLNTHADSQLVIARGAKEAMIHVLYVADVNTAYHFTVPHRYEVTSRIIASSSGPAGIVHIPAYISVK